MMMKAGDCYMNILITILAVLLFLFAAVVAVYWFNLDTRLVKAMEKRMTQHYNDLPRDHRL